MKQFYALPLIFILLLIISFPSIAQQQKPVDSVKAKVQNDSLNRHLEEINDIVKKAEHQRIADSVKKAELLQEIENLRGRDSYRKGNLLSEIDEIDKKDSARKQEWKNKIEKLKENSRGFGVAPFEDTLFEIYTKIGPVRPEERAAAIARKIRNLYEDDFFKPDSIIVSNNETTFDISYGDVIIMSITDWDARWQETGKEQLARKYAGLIREAIMQEKEENRLVNILLRVGLALLIIIAIWMLVKLANRLFSRGVSWIRMRKARFFKGIKLRNIELLTPDRQQDFALNLLYGLKWLIILILLYITLPLIFSLFPFTRGWADILFDWIWSPVKRILASVWHYLPNLFAIVVIFLVTRYVIRFLQSVAYQIERGQLRLAEFYPEWAMPTFKIIRFLLYAFMFIVIFPYLPGSDSPVFQGVSIFLGVLFSLGSTSAIANIVAGLVITYMRPFKIGDRIKIADVTGDVIEKNLLITRVRTIKNEEITIPNSSILSGHTINYTTSSQDLGLILNTTVTIGYDVPWRQVHQLLKDAAWATEGIQKEKEAFVLQTSLDDYYVSYQLNAFTNEPHKMAAIYSGLHQHIQDKFNEAGIEIMSPHYRAMRDGNEPAVPQEYRKGQAPEPPQQTPENL